MTACSKEVGQVVVLVDSDYSATELDRVRAQVTSTDGNRDEFTFVLGTDIDYPFSFGLQPGDPDFRTDAVLEIEGSGTSFTERVVSKRKFVEFPENGTYLLPVFLGRDCADISCGPDLTCSSGECVPQDIRVSDLEDLGDGDEFANGSCTPGERRCSANNTASEVCLATNFPLVTEPCPNNTRCEGAGICVPVDGGGQVSLKLDIEGPQVPIEIIPTGRPTDRCMSSGCSFSYPRGVQVELRPVLTEFQDLDEVVPPVCTSEPCRLPLDTDTELLFKIDAVLRVRVMGDGVVRISDPDYGDFDCTGAPCTVKASPMDIIDLLAIPNGNATFDGWVGVSNCPGPMCGVMPMGGREVVANFSGGGNTDFPVTVNVQGMGRVRSNPPGIDCPGTCTANFPAGTLLELNAFPSAGQAFDGWHDGLPCLDFEQCNFELTTAHTETARFKPLGANSGQIEVRTSESGRVVAIAPAGTIDCGTDCWSEYPPATQVTLEAMPLNGADFTGWADAACMGSGNICTLPSVVGHVTVLPTFGFGRDPVRDITGTSEEDLAVACFSQDDLPLEIVGSVYVVRGPVTTSGTLQAEAVRQWSATMSNAEAGSALAFIGDIDLDGNFDLAIGAPGYDNDRGAVFIVLGSFSLPAALTPSMMITGTSPGDRFGESLTTLGPFGGLGASSLVVGAPGAGEVYLFRGGNGFVTMRSAASADVVLTTPAENDRFGASVAGLGRFEGDQRSFLAVGAPSFGMGMPVGRVVAIPVPPPPFMGMIPVGMNPTGGYEFVGEASVQQLGHSLTALGDWDGNGQTDFAMGTLASDVVFATSGPHSGLSNGAARGQAGFREFEEKGEFGRSLGAADLNGDGFNELVVGAPVRNGRSRGAVVVFPGGTSPPVPFTITDGCGTCVEEGFGQSVGSAGDINDDGFEDLAVSSLYTGQTEGTGRISLFFGGLAIPQTSADANVELFGPSDQSDCYVVPSGDAIPTE